MSLSSILALVDAKHGASTLRLAGLASEKLAAPVDALIVRRDARESLPMIGEGVSGEVVQQIMDAAAADAEADVKAARAVIDAWPYAADAQVIEDTGRVGDVVARVGRTHGLTIAPCGSDFGVTDAIDAALFRTGRPALISPLQEVKSVGDRIAIFWNDSAEAAKSVWGAIPFLRGAGKITAFSVDDLDVAEASLGRLKDGLARAGVNIQTQAIDESDASRRLVDAAAEMDADLVIMGAFTHSRLRELVLGGVTQSVLDGLARPTLMAH